jgi:hypothetical protein
MSRSNASTRWQRWGAVIDDHLNPVVVKELRQAVRSRFVSILVIVFLVLMVTILGLFLININPDRSNNVGRGAFLTILGFLQVATMIFVPGFVASRLSQERTSGDLGLIFATALPAGAIIRGKLLSGMMIALLLYSIATPFMTFTYLLRGIDLPTIFIFVGLSFLMVAPAVQYALLIACLPGKRTLRNLVLIASALTGIYLVPVFGIVIPGEMGLGRLGTRILDSEVWLLLLTLVVLIMLVVVLLFAWACAAVTSPASNRAMPVRLAMSGTWLLGGVISSLWAISTDNDILLIWYYASIIVFGLAMLAGVSQRDQLGFRVRRTVPARLWRRIPAFLFFSGSAAGLAWAVLTVVLTVVTLVAGQLAKLWELYDLADHLRMGIALASFGLIYALAGLVLQRRLLARWLRPSYTWTVGIALLTLGSLLSVVIEILVFAGVSGGTDLRLWQVLSPFTLGEDLVRTTVAYFAAAVIVPLMLVNRSWFMTQVRAFRPAGEDP